MGNREHNARLGNTVRDSGCDRCPCGCKYWEHDRCIDCGGTEVAPESSTVWLANQEERDEVVIALMEWAGTCEWRSRPGNRQATADQRAAYAERGALLRRLIEREGL